eukprot:TRINITY_DN46781_c0_g1_i1.p1 TRINITY_DN46781_c0_g1~~TRINITY_DN46781_c0_g1_i1.p1  ORF type:complete len:297 (-),score=43.84 TRINITY_DN46781_c0_g1_i1:30-920(-)
MFIDHDEKEVFYCVAWGRPELPPPQESNGERSLYLAFAGQNGCLFVRHLDSKMQPASTMSLVAHGGPINMIQVAPKDQNLIFSASKDESVRMWSTFSGACVAVFAGGQGHTSEVLAIDMHMDGKRLVSAGMDNTVRVWDVDYEGHLKTFIEGGHAAEKGAYFKPKVVQTPSFVTDLSCEWKPNYIDCVKWVGDLLLAKSVHDRILLFDITKPSPRSKKETALVLQDFALSQCNIWFMRFSLDPSCRYVVIGNIAGTAMIWDVDRAKAPIVKLTYPCLLYTSPSPRDRNRSRMPSSA